MVSNGLVNLYMVTGWIYNNSWWDWIISTSYTRPQNEISGCVDHGWVDMFFFLWIRRILWWEIHLWDFSQSNGPRNHWNNWLRVPPNKNMFMFVFCMHKSIYRCLVVYAYCFKMNPKWWVSLSPSYKWKWTIEHAGWCRTTCFLFLYWWCFPQLVAWCCKQPHINLAWSHIADWWHTSRQVSEF